MIKEDITGYNPEGQIVIKIYIDDKGSEHPDSWVCPEGWGTK